MLSKGNPPVWKIDGKALLQKYVPFKQDDKILYKNTSVVSTFIRLQLHNICAMIRLRLALKYNQYFLVFWLGFQC